LTSAFECCAFLLDLDGVLVDSRAVVERTWRRWAARHGLDEDTIVAHAHGRPTAETVAAVAPHLSVDQEAAKLLAWELADTADLRPLPGAARLVATLAASPWAVVTSGNAALATRRLTRVGLPLPPVLVSADDVPSGKPDPAPYRLAAGLLQMEPADCVVVEDSPAGVQAGRAAEMRVVALTTTHRRHALTAAMVLVPDLESIVLTRRVGGVWQVTVTKHAT
jgi:sugar-phosphatase